MILIEQRSSLLKASSVYPRYARIRIHMHLTDITLNAVLERHAITWQHGVDFLRNISICSGCFM